jgi:two-component system LytT family response regulator
METDTHLMDKLCFISRSRQISFSLDKIIRLEAASNYTRIHLTNHSPILMAKVLRVYAELLKPYGFIRTHKSHLVNMRFIVAIDCCGFVRMADQSMPEISRRKRSQVFAEFMKCSVRTDIGPNNKFQSI